MARTRIINLLAGAALVGVIALAAGCGGSGGGATAATAPSKAPSKATIGVANSGLGMILVDSQGRTLYLFKKDSGMTSACSGAVMNVGWYAVTPVANSASPARR